MSSNWVSFAKTMKGRMCHLRVDVLAAQNKAYAKYGWVVCAGVLLRRPSQDGLAQPDETETLRLIERTVMAVAADPDQESAAVGSVTSGGRMDIFLHTPDKEATVRAVDLVLARFPEHGVEIRSWYDPRWETYLGQLYPTSADWLYISARSDAPRPLFGRDVVSVQQVPGK